MLSILLRDLLLEHPIGPLHRPVMLGVFACVTATSSGGGSGHYRVAVTEYPVEPALAYSYSYNTPGRMATASSAWSFNYNPAYIPPARNNVKAGLLVRVQNDSTAVPLSCINNRYGTATTPPISTSVLYFLVREQTL